MILCAKMILGTKNGRDQLSVTLLKLEADSPDAFLESVSSKKPSVFIVPESDVPQLLKMTDIIDDKGEKNDSIALTSYLKKSDPQRIPLLTGKYSKQEKNSDSPEPDNKSYRIGKVERSIITLLSNWVDDGISVNRHNAYILGLDELLLKEFFKDCDEDSPYIRELQNKIFELAVIKKHAKKRAISATRDVEQLNEELIGKSDQMIKVKKQIPLAGLHTENVLLLGETGTGKSKVASCIHRYSPLQHRPFVTFACGAVTGTLFESELFGHVKGAFTGAKTDRKGLWLEAGSGTLFFDEIGDLPKEQQSKLVVALGRKKIRPVGSDKEFAVHARLIFATNQKLWEMVKQGSFREDLYWRITRIVITMPPLRKQKDSIRYIAQKLWQSIKQRTSEPDLSDEILETLEKVNWTGNIRALKAILSSLYFNNVKKQPKEVNDLYEVLGELEIVTDEYKIKDRPNVDLSKYNCKIHLSKCEEYVQSCIQLLKPYAKQTKGGKPIQDLNQQLVLNRLDQLKDLIIESPFIFYDEKTFTAMNILNSKILYFNGLLEKERWQHAKDYLKMELLTHLKNVQALLFKSFQAVL